MAKQQAGSGNAEDLLAPQTMTIVIAVLVVVLTIILYLFTKKPNRRSILLIGFSDVGKTTLLYQVSFGVNLKSFLINC